MTTLKHMLLILCTVELWELSTTVAVASTVTALAPEFCIYDYDGIAIVDAAMQDASGTIGASLLTYGFHRFYTELSAMLTADGSARLCCNE